MRVLRTAREMGIETVSVFAEDDAAALHVSAADRAEPLGPGPVIRTYLSIPAILDAARRSSADAIHPGYGFLSENAAFARAVSAAGLVWVGAPPDAIDAMGDKLRSRTRMEKAGVPVVPGSPAGIRDDASLAAEAERLGYPVLVKASAGGGGKGMSRVERANDLEAALAEGRRIAAAAFGDDAVYLEKLLDRARHVEFQVFGDGRGNVVHLGERECSVQRRHQKIVEETPSTALDADRRRKMGEAAVAAARAVGYVGAGTIEFLLDAGGRFHFLEMNTRLQVEHPITEETLSVDLVRAQIDVAAGAELPMSWRAGEPVARGHAIEMRLYAEDPVEFLPRSGTILEWIEPSGPGVRVDAGVGRGSRVGVDYDPLLAKLVVHASDRAAAVDRGRRALAEWVVLGVETNLDLLRDVLASDAFRSGDYSTDLVPSLLRKERAPVPDAAWIAAALALRGERAGRPPETADPWASAESWRP